MRRLEEYNTGVNVYTKGNGPWKLVYLQRFEKRAEAVKAGKKIKEV